jgi:LacI family transcriptional regulator
MPPDKEKNPHPRPTLRVIADAAGVSLTTTSMALRNNPHISESTREHVQAVAKKLGYHRDAKLSTLMQHLRQESRKDKYEVLAYLPPYRDDRWKHFAQHDFYLGASKRAYELGYKIEVFYPKHEGMTEARMSQLLRARGIRGILLAGVDSPEERLDLDYQNFASLSFSYSIKEPRLHLATSDFYRGMTLALKKLKEKGYQRIGLMINPYDDAKALNLWSAAYHFYSDQIPKKQQVPVHRALRLQGNPKAWYLKHKPDAIISAGVDFPKEWDTLYRESLPEDVCFASMNIFFSDERSVGIDPDKFTVGYVGCGQLVSLLERNEIGIPESPITLTCEGHWVENYGEWLNSLGSERTHPIYEIDYHKKQEALHF